MSEPAPPEHYEEEEPAWAPLLPPPRDPPREPPVNVDPLAKYDGLWRKQPVVMGFMHYARYVPGLAAQFQTVVPGEFWIMVEDHEADISCPCGATPRCRFNGITECACPRLYAYLGSDVYVAYTEGKPGE
jgi:hypothetical protein